MPFRVVYGHDPPHLQEYEPGELRVVTVARVLQDRDAFLDGIRYLLIRLSNTPNDFMTVFTGSSTLLWVIGSSSASVIDRVSASLAHR